MNDGTKDHNVRGSGDGGNAKDHNIRNGKVPNDRNSVDTKDPSMRPMSSCAKPNCQSTKDRIASRTSSNCCSTKDHKISKVCCNAMNCRNLQDYTPTESCSGIS